MTAQTNSEQQNRAIDALCITNDIALKNKIIDDIKINMERHQMTPEQFAKTDAIQKYFNKLPSYAIRIDILGEVDKYFFGDSGAYWHTKFDHAEKGTKCISFTFDAEKGPECVLITQKICACGCGVKCREWRKVIIVASYFFTIKII